MAATTAALPSIGDVLSFIFPSFKEEETTEAEYEYALEARPPPPITDFISEQQPLLPKMSLDKRMRPFRIIQLTKKTLSNRRYVAKVQRKNRAEETLWQCKECSTAWTPQRRRGPQGLDTLCNKCGLRWFRSKR